MLYKACGRSDGGVKAGKGGEAEARCGRVALEAGGSCPGEASSLGLR